MMKSVLSQYIKAVFFKRFWIYLALLPDSIDVLTLYIVPRYHIEVPLALTVVLFLMFLQIANYQAWNELYNPSYRPRVYLDYDLEALNICYLQLKNIGNDHAKDVNVIFEPNLLMNEARNEKINDLPFLKRVDFLTINSSIRFFFGSLISPGSDQDNTILRQFQVRISYYDSRGKRYFEENQIINPKQFLGSSPRGNPLIEVSQSLKSVDHSLRDISRKIPRP